MNRGEKKKKRRRKTGIIGFDHLSRLVVFNTTQITIQKKKKTHTHTRKAKRRKDKLTTTRLFQ